MMKSARRLAGMAAVLAMGGNLAWAAGAPVQSSLSMTKLSYSRTSLGVTDGGTSVLRGSPSSAFLVYAVPNVGDYANAVSSGMLPGDHVGCA